MWRGNKLQGLVWFFDGASAKFEIERERKKINGCWCQSRCVFGALAGPLCRRCWDLQTLSLKAPHTPSRWPGDRPHADANTSTTFFFNYVQFMLITTMPLSTLAIYNKTNIKWQKSPCIRVMLFLFLKASK